MNSKMSLYAVSDIRPRVTICPTGAISGYFLQNMTSALMYLLQQDHSVKAWPNQPTGHVDLVKLLLIEPRADPTIKTQLLHGMDVRLLINDPRVDQVLQTTSVRLQKMDSPFVPKRSPIICW
jgi:hypothetical protein